MVEPKARPARAAARDLDVYKRAVPTGIQTTKKAGGLLPPAVDEDDADADEHEEPD